MELCQFHLFTHHGYWYFYNVESGEAYRITPDLVGVMRRLSDKNIINLRNCENDIINVLSELKMFKCRKNKSDVSKEIANPEITGISLNIAQECNMNCVYCYGGKGTYGNPGFMSERTAVSAINFLLDFAQSDKDLSLIFFGGEPLLNFSLIKQIIEYTETDSRAKQKKFHFSITTNGSLLKSHLIKFLNKYKFAVTISIDGDKTIQNRNRPLKNGKNSFKAVNRGTRKFLKTRDGNAMGRATITTDNTDLEKISSTINRMGFKRFDYALVTADHTALYALSDFQYRRINQDLERQAEVIIKNIIDGRRETNIRITEMTQRLKSTRKKSFYCGAARNFMAVSSTGDLYPCHRFVGLQDWKIGDVNGLWNHVWQKHFRTAGIDNDMCHNCWARYLCGGGCMHDNYIFSGKIHQPDPRNCAEIQHRIEMAIYVYDRLKELNHESLLKM